MNKFLSIIFVTFIFLEFGTSKLSIYEKKLGSEKEIVHKLYNLVQNSQIKKDKSFFPPFHWAEKEGIYPSFVKLNFFGSPEMTLLREEIEIFDNNMFVTNWVLETLIESSILGTIKLEDESIIKALHAIANCKDKNFSKYPIYSFWSQIDINGTWNSWPENLKNIMKSEEDFTFFIKTVLNEIGLNFLWKDIEPIANEISSMGKAFNIPSDFDDTSCSLGLGSLLYTIKNNLPESYSFWKESNKNITSISDLLVQYSYHPFSSDLNRNTIDPRTYFFFK